MFFDSFRVWGLCRTKVGVSTFVGVFKLVIVYKSCNENYGLHPTAPVNPTYNLFHTKNVFFIHFVRLALLPLMPT